MSFELPEDLAALSAEELTALYDAALAESAELLAVDTDALTDEQIERIEFLAEATTTLSERRTEVETATQERADRLATARGKLESAQVAEEEVEEEVVVPDDASELVEAEAVTAAARPSLRAISRRAPKPEAPEADTREHVVITASADIPGVPSGSVIADVDALAEAAIKRAKGLPKGKNGAYTQLSLASIERPESAFSVKDRPGMKTGVVRADDVIDAARNEHRLEGGSLAASALTAAGGWCAPSEVLYDLCELESREGLLDLPRISVPRGGIQFTKGFQFPDFAGAGFTQTEMQAEAGTPKVCIDIECPEFEEERLDAIGVCVSAPLLTRAAYPELIARYIRGVLIAHEHYVSAYQIARLRAILGAAVAVPNVWPNATSILTALEIVAEGERQRYRLPFNTTLEVLLPHWVKAGIRADLSQRTGVDLLNVTDAQIENYFATRKLRVQWLYNYQDLTITGGSPSGPVPAVDFPGTLDVIMYPAGSFVVGSTDVIDLSTIYDSVKLSTNEYTALFTEEGMLVANTCADGRRLSVPFSVSGLTAAAIINQDWGSVPPLVTDESL